MDTNGTAVMEWIICNVWLKRVSRRPSICCFPVLFFSSVFRLMCKPLWHITPPHVFKLAMDWPVQDRQASHVYNIHKHTQAGSTSHLNDGGSLRLWVCVSVCGNDVMLAGLSVENSSFGVENSSFAVWEAFVVCADSVVTHAGMSH